MIQRKKKQNSYKLGDIQENNCKIINLSSGMGSYGIIWIIVIHYASCQLMKLISK